MRRGPELQQTGRKRQRGRRRRRGRKRAGQNGGGWRGSRSSAGVGRGLPPTRRPQDAIDTFISITGASEAVAVQKLEAAIGTMDGIIDTVSASHPVVPLLSLLKMHGKMINVGLPTKPMEVPAFSLIQGGRSLAGSNIGGMRDTQEMINFAAKHNIAAEVEVVPMDYVNTAFERLAKGDVRYRFVVDVANSLAAAE